jgi:deazaflavin-dependent oxidoreductase (nitroreductase family)
LIIDFQQRIANPISRRLAPFLPGQAVIETVGRHSGLPRRTPVGGRLEGSTFWLVSEFGRQSNYVRNIAANPRVRVQLNGRWYAGTATVLDHDDPRARLKRLPLFNSLVVRAVGTALLTLRIDLDDPHNARN